MPHYRAYILGRASSIQSALDFDCETDSQAITAVRSMQPAAAVELWQGSRRVAIVAPGAATAAPAPASDEL